MRAKPCVNVPMSEARWIITAIGTAYVRLANKAAAMEGFSELTGKEPVELEQLRIDRDELLHSIDLLELRMRETLTGDAPAPAQDEYSDTES